MTPTHRPAPSTSRLLRRPLVALAVVAALAAAALPAQAHRPWLLPSAAVVDGPQTVVTIDAAISEDLFEFDSFPLALDALQVTAPDGSALATQSRAEARRRISFDVDLVQKGTYRIAGVTDTAMATYKDKAGGEAKRWRGPAAALAQSVPADAQELQVNYMLSRAETFVTRDAPGPVAPALAGKGLELQPLTNPTDLSVGDTSRFRLLLDGKPYANADVTVIRGGNRYRYKIGELALHTDAKGEFAVTWPEAGRYWLGANHGGRPAGPGGMSGMGGPGAPAGMGGAGGPGAAHQHADGAPAGTPAPQAGAAPNRRESYSATFEVLPK